MKIIGLAIGVLSLAIGYAGTADGLCRNRVQVVAVAAAVEVAPVYAAAYVPYAAYPSYSVSYSGGSQEALIKFLIDSHKRQEEKIEALSREVFVLRSGGAVPGALPKLDKDDIKLKGIKALSNNCAVCHEALEAKAKGGGFVMFEADKMVELSPKQLLRMATRTSIADERQMPPPKSGRKLSDEHYGDIMAFLRSME